MKITLTNKQIWNNETFAITYDSEVEQFELISNKDRHTFPAQRPSDPDAKSAAQIRQIGKDPAEYKQFRGRILLHGDSLTAVMAIVEWLETLKAQRKAYLTKIGVPILQAARDAEDKYSRDFDRMMEDENNDGVNPPTKPTADLDELYKQYPIAAAYLRAKAYEYSNHYAQSAAGKTAAKKIADGGDYKAALAEMEKAWSAHVEAHIWD